MPTGNPIFGLRTFVVIALALTCATSPASLIYTYDFPGSPGSGLASNQTSPQPSNGIMSDFTRNGGLTATGNSGVFGSTNLPTSNTLDPSVFTAFTITADQGFVLSLTQLTFDSLKTGSTGGGNQSALSAEVDVFLNGSTTAYASFDWTPKNAPMTHYTFNFTPVTFADKVTTATFKFFTWNAQSTNGIQFDNVALYGAIDVPEAADLGPAVLVIGWAVFGQRFYRRRLY